MVGLKLFVTIASVGLAIALMAPSACTEGNTGIVLQQIGPNGVGITAGTACTCTQSTLFVTSGEVDLSQNANTAAFSCWGGQLTILNNLANNIETTPNGQNLIYPQQDDFLMTEMDIDYQHTDGTPYLPQPEAIPLSGGVTAGGTAFACLDLCSPNAQAKLQGEANLPLTLLLQITVKGHLAGGQAATSTQLQFPITYFKSNLTSTSTCPTGETLQSVGPPWCGAFFGQDGTGFVCETASPG
jgi:hypothetical protein